MRAAGAVVALAALGLAGCGGGGGRTETTAPPARTVARAPARTATAPTPTRPRARTATAPARAPARTATAPARTSTSKAPSAGETGAAEPTGVPVHYTIVAGSRLDPRVIAIPAALPVELAVTSGDNRAHRARLALRRPLALAVPAGGTVRRRLRGLPRGRFAVLVDGRRAGLLVTGVEPGP